MADLRSLKRIKSIMLDIAAVTSKGFKDFHQVTAHLKLLNELWNDYGRTEANIIIDDVKSSLMNEIEAAYYTCKRDLLTWESSLHVPAPSTCDTTLKNLMEHNRSFLEEMSVINKRANANDSQVLLPKFNLPYFSGNHSEFPNFKNLFEDTIIGHPTLSKVEMFKYLKIYLKGEAEALVNHIEITEENFDIAWDAVKQRYQKKRQALSILMDKFLFQPAIKVANSRTYYKLGDTSKEVLRAIKQLGSAAEKRDPWLIRILLDKLDHEGRKAWGFQTSNEDFPTLESFLEFVKNRGGGLETCETQTNSKSNINSTKQAPIKIHNATCVEETCPKCKEIHSLYKCKEFLTLSTLDKRKFVGENQLCFNCLHTGHRVNKCKSRYFCSKCKSRHHYLLHL